MKGSASVSDQRAPARTARAGASPRSLRKTTGFDLLWRPRQRYAPGPVQQTYPLCKPEFSFLQSPKLCGTTRYEPTHTNAELAIAGNPTVIKALTTRANANAMRLENRLPAFERCVIFRGSLSRPEILSGSMALESRQPSHLAETRPLALRPRLTTGLP